MDSQQTRDLSGSAALTDLPAHPAEPDAQVVVRFDEVSKWYGNVIGDQQADAADSARRDGAARPQRRGQVDSVAIGHRPALPQPGRGARARAQGLEQPAAQRHIGLCPEQDAFYEWMTGRDFVRTCARLDRNGPAEATAAAERALATVGMTSTWAGPIRGYSKGMRQRTKLAQALVHDPRGAVPGRTLHRHRSGRPARIEEIIRGLGRRGHSVVVSSHVLHEVKALRRT